MAIASDTGRVTAIAWSLVGLMAASLGVLSAALYAGLSRIDALGGRLDGRIDALGARLESRMDGLESRLDTRLGAVEGELRGLRDNVHALDIRLTRAGG